MSGRLTFDLLDDVAIATQKGKDTSEHLARITSVELGPLAEWLLLSNERGGLLTTLRVAEHQPFVKASLNALRTPGNVVFCEHEFQRAAFLTTSRNPLAANQVEWSKFQMRMSKAGQDAGLHATEAHAMVAALEEIETNIHEHSERSHDGLVAFLTRPGELAFIVADSGIGPLASFQSNEEYVHVTDAGQALKLTIADGQSRFGSRANRGLGYHSLFIGLAALNASLRFRAGNRALVIEGQSPSRIGAALLERVPMQGFLASVVCRSLQASLLH